MFPERFSSWGWRLLVSYLHLTGPQFSCDAEMKLWLRCTLFTSVDRMRTLGWVTTVTLLSTLVQAVDKGNFKTCDQSSFCRWLILPSFTLPPYCSLHQSFVLGAHPLVTLSNNGGSSTFLTLIWVDPYTPPPLSYVALESARIAHVPTFCDISLPCKTILLFELSKCIDLASLKFKHFIVLSNSSADIYIICSQFQEYQNILCSADDN